MFLLQHKDVNLFALATIFGGNCLSSGSNICIWQSWSYYLWEQSDAPVSPIFPTSHLQATRLFHPLNGAHCLQMNLQRQLYKTKGLILRERGCFVSCKRELRRWRWDDGGECPEVLIGVEEEWRLVCDAGVSVMPSLTSAHHSDRWEASPSNSSSSSSPPHSQPACNNTQHWSSKLTFLIRDQ